MGAFAWISRPILTRLIQEFYLQDQYPIDPNLALPLIKSVQPVYEVKELLSTLEIVTSTQDLSAAAGTYIPFHTIPSGERWEIIMLIRPTTTANTTLIISDGVAEMGQEVAGLTTAFDLCRGFKLEAGWSIGLDTTGNGGDAARGLHMIVKKFLVH